MRRFSDRARRWNAPQYAGLWGFTLVLLVALGLTLADHLPVGAAEPPETGGTIVWAVHEGMPSFDIHYENSYVAVQPIGRLCTKSPAFPQILVQQAVLHQNSAQSPAHESPE